jgi:hypothetical protein
MNFTIGVINIVIVESKIIIHLITISIISVWASFKCIPKSLEFSLSHNLKGVAVY